MFGLAAVRNRRLRPVVRELEAFYDRTWTAAEIRAEQLRRFNERWQSIARIVPYYRELREQRNLPLRFESLEEFCQLLPVLDRVTIRQHQARMIDPTRPVETYRITGGSTSEPVHLPCWFSEASYGTANFWYARKWYGIQPADRLFLIWGHSHLLGSGLKGRINAVKRQVKDRLLGYYRYSGYDLTEAGLRSAARAMLKFRPAYVVAYAVALDRFVRVNADLRQRFAELRLKAAIASAESFPEPDSGRRVGEVLGCPVVMEYGAVEAGPIAYQKSDGRYAIFWRDHLIEGVASSVTPGAYEIYLTSLYPRCFPLIRYSLGDLISEDPNRADFAQRFETMMGRVSDILVLPGNTVVHSVALAHTIKDVAVVSGFQAVQHADGSLTMRYMASRELEPEEIAAVRRRLNIIHADRAGVKFQRVSSLEQTRAGKTRLIVRE